MSDDSGMTVFTVIDFVLAGVSALFALIFAFKPEFKTEFPMHRVKAGTAQ